MSMFVPASFQSRYNNNVELALQQKKSRLLETVEVTDDASADKIKVTDIIGNTAAQEADERHGDTKYVNTPHDGVWLPKLPELYFADLVDHADKLATAIDIKGAYTMAGAATVARAKDQRILEGFYGSIISGKDGTITTPFPASQIVPVTVGGTGGTPMRMNTAKLRAASKMLTQGWADDENDERWMVLTAEQNDDLLTEIPATSSDFKGAFGGTFEDGKITGLLGWRFKHLELSNPMLGTIPQLSLTVEGYRKTPFWTKSGLRVNFWDRLRTMIDPLPQKLGSVQVFAGTTLAATRTQSGRTGIILNSEVAL